MEIYPRKFEEILNEAYESGFIRGIPRDQSIDAHYKNADEFVEWFKKQEYYNKEKIYLNFNLDAYKEFYFIKYDTRNNKKSAIKKLDLVLDHFYKIESINNGILVTHPCPLGFSSNEFYPILKKLVDEKNIELDENPFGKYYRITFDGKMLKESGGYKRKSIDKCINTAINKVEIFTVILAGVFAFLYYCDQIFHVGKWIGL